MSIINYKNEELLALVPLLHEAQDEMVKATLVPVVLEPAASIEEALASVPISHKPDPWISGAIHLVRNDVTHVVRCRDCRYNVANQTSDPYDITDYTDITCTYFMTDGMSTEDFCSKGERKQT